MMGSLVKEDLAVSFDSLEDPRLDRTKLYPLSEVIFLAIVGALLGVESWRGLELIGNEKLEFLRRFFSFKNGIPSHQTIGRVFSILKPKAFEQFFIAWSATQYGENSGKQIAIDGKTLRGSFDKATSKQALHLLNACAVDNGITLAQLEVGAKTNEITVVPQMIDSLNVKGAMISVDALNTQKDVAEKIIEAGADYTLALKGNHKTLNEDVKLLFDTTPINPGDHVEEVEKSHGRLTVRTYDIIKASLLAQASDWKGLLAVGRVESRVDEKAGDTRYYLLSYIEVSRFAKSSRNHWGVESMHWTLDVTFGEDGSRKRKDAAPQNYSLIRKFALNTIRTVKGKLSVPLAHIKANANPNFLTQMIRQSGFKEIVKEI